MNDSDVLNGDINAQLAKKLSVALQAAELGVWEWDLAADRFTYSARAKEIFGFAPDVEVTRERILEVMHPEDHLRAKEQAAQSMDPKNKQRLPYRYRIRRADSGEVRWIHAFGEPIFRETDGTPVAVGFIGTIQDVTSEVEAKERLEYQEARLRLAIEASGMAVWEIDLATETVTHSPELNRLCGFSPDARPTLAEFRSRYAPGERERLEKIGAEARSRGETKVATEIHHIWPDRTEKWLSLRAQLAPGEKNYGGRIIGVLIDVTEQKQREQHQALLLSELKHRIKNSFAVTQAVISQSLRGDEISAASRAKLFARLQALASAHDEIVKGAWESASLKSVIGRARSTFEGNFDARVHVEGNDAVLPPRAALAFSLVLHELFTNAIKYGSLSKDGGSIRIDLETHTNSPSYLSFVWSEHDGPVVSEPVHTGFGTRLLDRLLSAELDAGVTRRFDPAGFVCQIRVPLEKLAVSAPPEI
ncbi:MAG: PAS domain-containing protein [Mesorhizobium sp.]|nr:PAS domain-containing protein [Mesorhizobium sp.]